jgi:lauroyl/myristoyl acyltransferase
MKQNSLLNSKLSVQLSILIGKYLPKRVGYGLSHGLGSLLGSFQSWEINKAIHANQSIVNPAAATSDELREISKKVLAHAGKCFYDLYHFFNKPTMVEVMVPVSDSIREFIKLSHEGQGYVVVAPHLSNFDLVVCSLVKYGFKGKVLSYPNPGSGYQLQNQIRSSFGLDVVPLGDSNLDSEITTYIREGGMVATGVDRPLPGRKKRHFVNFFGRPSPLPVGYITTALAADVPVIAVTAIMEPDGTYGFRHSGPITLQKHKNKLDEIILNTELVLKKVEEYIKLAPEQWLMFYPVWPDSLTEGA